LRIEKERVTTHDNGNVTCLGDALIAADGAATGDLPLAVLGECAFAGDGARSLVTGAGVEAFGNGDGGMAAGGDAALGAGAADVPVVATLTGALSTKGLLTFMTRAESGVGTRAGDAAPEVDGLGAPEESAGDMGSGGATGLGLSLSVFSMARLEQYLTWLYWSAKELSLVDWLQLMKMQLS
jgi:hypothetical protein